MTVQNEVRWLIETIIDEWPRIGSLGDTHPPDDLALRNRNDAVTFYREPGVGDPDAPADYEAEREQGAPTDGWRTVSVSKGATTRDFYGNKPQYDVTTTLDVRVEEKSVYEGGTAESDAAHETLVTYIQNAINTQLTYPEVDPDAEDIGFVVYLDAAIVDEDDLASDDKDYYLTTFSVRLRGREDTFVGTYSTDVYSQGVYNTETYQ